MDPTELVQRAIAGEHEAFGDLVRRYERLVLAIAWNQLRNTQSAQDVAQDTFLTAFRQLGQLRDPALFSAWIARIAIRCCHQVRKKQPTIAGRPLSEPVAIPLDPLVLHEQSDRVLTAIQQLPEQEHDVVILRYFEGYDLIKIAELTGRPIGTVSKQISRAVQRLKGFLVEVE